MNALDYNKTCFLKSYSTIDNIDIHHGIEVVFVGYSNSGKSSAINALTNQKKLSRFSKTPGRTQLINFFKVSKDMRIVDLPGYGYAKAPLLVREKWQKNIYNYLQKRQQIMGLVLVMDIRYPCKIFDQKIIDIAISKNIFLLILLTKCDKLKQNKQKVQCELVYKKLHVLLDCVEIEFFSSLKKIGIKQVKLILNTWYKKYIFSKNT